MKSGLVPLVATAGAIIGGLVVIASLYFLSYPRATGGGQEGAEIDRVLTAAVVAGVALTLGSAATVWRWSPRAR